MAEFIDSTDTSTVETSQDIPDVFPVPTKLSARMGESSGNGSSILEIIPLAAIICIAVCAYVLLVLFILCIRSILISQGFCTQSCLCCCSSQPDGKPCCRPNCCKCNCCPSDSCKCPKLVCNRSCFESVCPLRRGVQTSRCAGCGLCLQMCCDSCAKLGTAEGPTFQIDMGDVMQCSCCANPDCCWCCSFREPLCECGQCNCLCACSPPDCTDINCLCFSLTTRPVDQPDCTV